MILISHRGNINGENPKRENSLSYIDEAIEQGYDVEIDVWCTSYDQLYLGHDKPEHYVKLDWLLDRKDNLWVHCKDFNSLSILIDTKLQIFYHQHENHTIIGNTNIIWSHNIDEATDKSIIPLLNIDTVNSFDFNKNKYYGICSDYINNIKEKLWT